MSPTPFNGQASAHSSRPPSGSSRVLLGALPDLISYRLERRLRCRRFYAVMRNSAIQSIPLRKTRLAAVSLAHKRSLHREWSALTTCTTSSFIANHSLARELVSQNTLLWQSCCKALAKAHSHKLHINTFWSTFLSLFLSSCSQILITFHPKTRSIFTFFLSRVLFLSILSVQNFLSVLGIERQRLHPCKNNHQQKRLDGR